MAGLETDRPRKPGLHELTAEKLRESRQKLEVMFPGKPSTVVFGLAQYIIINTLGPDFWTRECCTFSDPQPFLRTQKQIRQIHLAQMLFNSHRIRGFGAWLKRAQNDDIEAANFELFWLTTLGRVFSSVELNVPSGKRGSDFDLILRDGLGFEELNAEVKTRIEPLENRKKVRRFIDAARSQLPAGSKGAVLFRCSTRESIQQSELDSAIHATVKGSSRLAFVAYCWEADSTDELIAFKSACVTRDGRDDGLMQAAPLRRWTPESLIDEWCGN